MSYSDIPYVAEIKHSIKSYGTLRKKVQLNFKVKAKFQIMLSDDLRNFIHWVNSTKKENRIKQTDDISLFNRIAENFYIQYGQVSFDTH